MGNRCYEGWRGQEGEDIGGRDHVGWVGRDGGRKYREK